MFIRNQFPSLLMVTLSVFICLNLTIDNSYAQEENPLLLAQGLYKQGNFIEAIRVLDAFIEKAKDNPNQKKQLAEANYFLAKMYYEAGDDRQVEIYLTMALQSDRAIGRDEEVEAFKGIVDRLRETLPDTGPRTGDVKKVTVNDLDFEMVWIPPGEFLMGAPSWEQGRYAEEGPQHKVTISKGFWLGKYEVTQRQWQMVTGSNQSFFKNAGPNAPVEQVSWNGCQEFIQNLNTKTGSRFRLPTEAEWEYACRAGTTGDRYDKLDAIAWYIGNSGGTTHPVGQKQANSFGLYDMLGNVWEWCQDWFDSGYYEQSPLQDPQGPLAGIYRVYRGGGWHYNTQNIRSANRNCFDPSAIGRNLGFRLAMTDE